MRLWVLLSLVDVNVGLDELPGWICFFLLLLFLLVIPLKWLACLLLGCNWHIHICQHLPLIILNWPAIHHELQGIFLHIESHWRAIINLKSWYFYDLHCRQMNIICFNIFIKNILIRISFSLITRNNLNQNIVINHINMCIWAWLSQQL